MKIHLDRDELYPYYTIGRVEYLYTVPAELPLAKVQEYEAIFQQFDEMQAELHKLFVNAK